MRLYGSALYLGGSLVFTFVDALALDHSLHTSGIGGANERERRAEHGRDALLGE